MLDNRELAALIWLIIALCAVLSHQRFRASLVSILRSLFQPVILLPLLSLFAWAGLEVWLGARLGLWNAGLTRATILWTLGAGVLLLFDATTASADPDFLRRTVAGTIGVTVFLEFFVNLFVMSLPAELVLQPIAASLAIGAAVAGTRDELRPAKTVLNHLLAVLGFGLVAFAAWQLYQDWDQINQAQLLRGFLLPIWLTVGLLPFLVLLRLYVVYDSVWRRINDLASSARARWRTRWALIVSFHLRHDELRRFTGHWVRQLSEAPTYAAARQVVKAFRKQEKKREQAATEEKERLERYAGVKGTDEDGRRLDCREFEETKKALLWLHTCQMGWYQRRGDRYRADLLDMIGDGLIRFGLPGNHAITLAVAENGQCWYAWRRTVTGWCFAIGAAGPPPDQWQFDGPEPPAGFPGQDPLWGDEPFSDEVNPNWW